MTALKIIVSIMAVLFNMAVIRPIRFVYRRNATCTFVGVIGGINVYQANTDDIAMEFIGAPCSFTMCHALFKNIVITPHDRAMCTADELEAVKLHEAGHHLVKGGMDKNFNCIIAMTGMDYNDPTLMEMMTKQEMAADSYAAQHGYGAAMASYLRRTLNQVGRENLLPLCLKHIEDRIAALENH